MRWEELGLYERSLVTAAAARQPTTSICAIGRDAKYCTASIVGTVVPTFQNILSFWENAFLLLRTFGKWERDAKDFG